MTSKFVSICVPCYNEEANIEKAYEAIVEVMESIPDIRFEILFEDNASQDRSEEILRSLAAKDSRVKVIFNEQNYGPGRSGSNCLFRSSGDAAILIACDLQDPPDLIPRFIELWNGDPVIVWGQREGSLESKAMSKVRSMYYWFMSSKCEIPLFPNVDGFGLYDRRILQSAEGFCNNNRGMKLFAAESQCSVRLIPYIQRARERGKSSYNLSSYFSLAFKMILESSEKPVNWCRNAGLICGAVSLVGFVFFLVFGLMTSGINNVSIELIGFVILFFLSMQLLFTSLLGYYMRSLIKSGYKMPLVYEKETLNMAAECKDND